MKKVTLILAAAMMAVTASAQVVTSRTYVKAEKPTTWYARIGMSINNAAGNNDYFKDDNSKGSRLGMDIDFGFQRPISNFGLYWGMELGVGTRGYSTTTKNETSYYGSTYTTETKWHMSAWNVKYSPFTFGYKYSVTDDIKLDAHLGAFISYDFTGSVKSETTQTYNGKTEKESAKTDWGDFTDDYYQSFDAGMQIGLGVWYKRFNLDFMYQRGFVGMYKDVEENMHSSNFEIRLGVAF